MKNKIKIFLYAVVIILIIVLSILLYMYSKHDSDDDISLPKRSNVQIGLGKIEDPLTWSTYTFDTSWKLRFPPGWIVNLDQNGGGVSFESSGFQQDAENMTPYGSGAKVTYSVFGEYDIFDKNIQVGQEFPNGDRTMMQKVKFVQNMTIDNNPAVYYQFFPLNNSDFIKRRVSIFKSGKVYRFNAVFAQEKDINLFESMVRSIKFIN